MSEHQVACGRASRAEASPGLFDALRDRYGLRNADEARDLGGSSNLNLLIADEFRRHLASGGVPCVQPVHALGSEPWILVEDRVVEVEPYVEHDAKMDSWQRLEVGLPTLGRIHTLLRGFDVSADGRRAPASNNIEPRQVVPGTVRGTHRIRQWDDVSPSEAQLAVTSEELAQMVDRAQEEDATLPRQLVHGDYWDNNVLFRDGRLVLVTDLDFMGERARVDDLALTLYYTNSTFSEDPTSDHHVGHLRALVDAYDSGLDDGLTRADRAALPVALARIPLGFIAMIVSLDSEGGARRLASEMTQDVSWALEIVHDLERWQAAFA